MNLEVSGRKYRYSELFGHTIQGEGKKKPAYLQYGYVSSVVILIAMDFFKTIPQIPLLGI